MFSLPNALGAKGFCQLFLFFFQNEICHAYTKAAFQTFLPAVVARACEFSFFLNPIQTLNKLPLEKFWDVSLLDHFKDFEAKVQEKYLNQLDEEMLTGKIIQVIYGFCW